MTRTNISQLTRRASRTINTPSLSPITTRAPRMPIALQSAFHTTLETPKHTLPQSARPFSTTRPTQKGLSPETENPQPKIAETSDTASIMAPVDISIDKYHELSDEYLNALVEKLEQLQEEREEVDCEYTAGVMTLTFPPNGTYVINKQPPNKQIWFSSPLSGPKRYDWVMSSEGQDAKEGTGMGDWTYVRDGSTLTSVLLKEIGVDMRELWAPIEHSGE